MQLLLLMGIGIFLILKKICGFIKEIILISHPKPYDDWYERELNEALEQIRRNKANKENLDK